MSPTNSPKKESQTSSRSHPYQPTNTRAEKQTQQWQDIDTTPTFSKRLWRFINPFQGGLDDVEFEQVEEKQDDLTPTDLQELKPADEQDTNIPMEVDNESSLSGSPIVEAQVEVLDQAENNTDNSQATLIASLQSDDSAIVADESDELVQKKDQTVDSSALADDVEANEVNTQAQDQPTHGTKRSKRSRGKRSESPALATTDATSTTPAAPLTTRITRRSTRSQTLKLDEPQEDSPSRQATPTPTEPEDATDKPQDEPQPLEGEATDATADNSQADPTVSSSHVEVVVESKKNRSSKRPKGKKGKKKSVVDKRAAEPEPSDDDKDETASVNTPSVTADADVEVPTPTTEEVEEEQQVTLQHIGEEQQRVEEAGNILPDINEEPTKHGEEEAEVDPFYAAHLQDVEAREEYEKEVFVTSTQFDDMNEVTMDAKDEEDENTVKYYPPEPSTEEEETAETTKYYPPSEVDDEIDPKAIYGLPDTETESAATSMPASVFQGSDVEEEVTSSSVDPIPSVLHETLEGSPALSFEFSPMQTPTDSPIGTPRPSQLRLTELHGQSSSDHEESERGTSERTGKGKEKARAVLTVEELMNLSLNPTHNLEVMVAFFHHQRGKRLTRGHADICHRLIEDCVEEDQQDTTSKWHYKNIAKAKSEVQGQDASPAQPSVTSVAAQTEPSMPRPAPQLKPMTMKRLAPPELLSSDEAEDGPRVKRVMRTASSTKTLATFSMDEYLEIEKYKGVPWDKLPAYIKIRRMIEWKGTEPPDVVRQRELERRQKRIAEDAAAKEREQKAKEEAERAAKEAEEAERAAEKARQAEEAERVVRKAREEAEEITRKAREEAEQIKRKAKDEAERIAKEAKEAAEAARVAREAREAEEAKRAAAKAKEAEVAERAAREARQIEEDERAARRARAADEIIRAAQVAKEAHEAFKRANPAFVKSMAWGHSTSSHGSSVTSVVDSEDGSAYSGDEGDYDGPGPATSNVAQMMLNVVKKRRAGSVEPEDEVEEVEADEEEAEGDDRGDSQTSTTVKIGVMDPSSFTFAPAPTPSQIKRHNSISEYERSPERFMLACMDTEEGVISPFISPLSSPVLSPRRD
ncbi:hypothetical protein BGW42_003233 [Actinomortierella wolfii]|nr:hypothetical protein BGW42_003233 [Actinomortierella wolfii]